MNAPTDPRWVDAITSFDHLGPGGDKALAEAHPDLVAAIRSIRTGHTLEIAGLPVTRQSPDRWTVDGDYNLASPWVVVQSLRSALRGRGF